MLIPQSYALTKHQTIISPENSDKSSLSEVNCSQQSFY